MPQFKLNVGDADVTARRLAALDSFDFGYVEAMFFTSTGPDDEKDDLGEDTTVAELSEDAWKRIADDCAAFRAAAGAAWLKVEADEIDGYDAHRAGADFWFTRNGHGAGFRDRDELDGPIGEALTAAAKTFRSVDLYRGDDGRLYLS